MEKFFEFDNGLQLFYIHNKINNATGINISFSCGSRCDKNIAGLSHFVEHMFFTGTKDENKEQISQKYFDFIRVNAYTNTREICFTGEILTTELKDYLSLVKTMILSSTFSPKAVEEEKKVVIQEIVRDNDKYDEKSARVFSALLYGEKYYEDGVLGNISSVEKITSKDVKNYVKTYFVANNCKVYISSPLSFSKIKSLVKNNFAIFLKENKSLNVLPYFSSTIQHGSKLQSIKENIDKNFLRLAFKLDWGYDANLKKLATLSLLSNIMDDMTDGAINDLRLKNGLVYSASTYIVHNEHDSVLVFKTDLSSENIKKCIDVFSEYLKKLKTNKISSEQLKKYKRIDKYYHETEIETLADRMQYLKNIAKSGKYIDEKMYYKEAVKITKEDVNSLIDELFDSNEFICSIYGNAKKSDIYSLEQINKKLFI